MSLSQPIGRLAESVRLRIKPDRKQVARSGVRPHDDRKRVFRSLAKAGGVHLDPQVEAMRIEAFLHLVNRRLV